MPAWVTSPVHRAVIALLIRMMKDAGMTQRDVSAKLGKSPSFVGKVEAVERNLSVLEFMAWAAAIGVDGAQILAQVEVPGEIEV